MDVLVINNFELVAWKCMINYQVYKDDLKCKLDYLKRAYGSHVPKNLSRGLVKLPVPLERERERGREGERERGIEREREYARIPKLQIPRLF